MQEFGGTTSFHNDTFALHSLNSVSQSVRGVALHNRLLSTLAAVKCLLVYCILPIADQCHTRQRTHLQARGCQKHGVNMKRGVGGRGCQSESLRATTSPNSFRGSTLETNRVGESSSVSWCAKLALWSIQLSNDWTSYTVHLDTVYSNKWHTPKNVNRNKKEYQWLKLCLDKLFDEENLLSILIL